MRELEFERGELLRKNARDASDIDRQRFAQERQAERDRSRNLDEFFQRRRSLRRQEVYEAAQARDAENRRFLGQNRLSRFGRTEERRGARSRFGLGEPGQRAELFRRFGQQQISRERENLNALEEAYNKARDAALALGRAGVHVAGGAEGAVDVLRRFDKATENVERARERFANLQSAFTIGKQFSAFLGQLTRIPRIGEDIARAFLGAKISVSSFATSSFNVLNSLLNFLKTGFQEFGTLFTRVFNFNNLERSINRTLLIIETFIRSTGVSLREIGKFAGRLVLVLASARRLFDAVAGGIASIPKRFKDFFTRDGGFFDQLKSADVQIEKLDARLQKLGQGLIAPTERFVSAQAEFQLVETRILSRLAELNSRIDILDSSRKDISALSQEIREIQTQTLRPIEAEISLAQSIAAISRFDAASTLEALGEQVSFYSDKLRELEIDLSGFSETTKNEVESLRSVAAEIYEATGEERDIRSFDNISSSAENYDFIERSIERIRNTERSRIEIGGETLKTVGEQVDLYRQQEELLEHTNRQLAQETAILKRRRLEARGEIEAQRANLAQLEAFRSERFAALEREKREKELELKSARQGFDVEKRRFELAKATANQEKVVIDIRKARLNLTKELGRAENTFAAQLGATIRAYNTERQQRELSEPLGAVENQNALQRIREGGNPDIEFNRLAESLNLATDGVVDFENAAEGAREEILRLDETTQNTSSNIAVRFRNEIVNSVANVRGAVSEVSNRVLGVVNQVITPVRDAVGTGIQQVGNIAQATVTTFGKISVKAFGLATQGVVKLGAVLFRLPSLLLAPIPIIGGLSKVITELGSAAIELFFNLGKFLGQSLISLARSFTSSLAKVINDIISTLRETLNILLVEVSKGIREAFTIIGNIARNTIGQLLSAIASFYRSIFNSVLSIIQAFQSYIVSVAKSIEEFIKGFIKFTVEAAVNVIRIPINVLINSLRLLVDVIIAPFKVLSVLIREIGELIRNLIISPLETIGNIVTAPFRALGFLLNALSFNNFNAHEQGQAVGNEYNAGIQQGINQPVERNMTRKFLETVEAKSPPKAGPFKDVGKWGENTGEAWGEGFAEGVARTNVDDAAASLRANTNNSVYGTSAQATRSPFSSRQLSTTAADTRDVATGFNQATTAGVTFGDRVGTAIRSLTDVFRIFQFGAQSLGSTIQSLRTSFSNLSLGAVGALALIGGALAATIRAANFKGIIIGFKQTGVVLNELRVAAGGTIDDINLMRASNLALAGATEVVRKELARDLPEILEIARAQAVRTGQSVEFLYESLTTGIKRASPRLIDNTGLVIRIGEAYNNMAKELGKSRDELTASDTQLAILRETLRAGRSSITALGDDTEGAAQKLERFRATITNIINRLSFGMQPALEGILNAFNNFLAGIDKGARAVASFLFVVTKTGVSGFQKFLGSIGNTTRQFFSRLIRVIGIDSANLLGGVSGVLENIFFGLVDVFASVAGAIAGVWQVIVGTVQGALEDIRVILEGESPPKEGPLKNIDKGAAAIGEAWLNGFVSAGVGKIEDYAKLISNTINNVFSLTNIPAPSSILQNTFEQAERLFGGLSVEELEERIERLDSAVVPFEKRLEIIREHFDAIQAASQTSLDAINRRISELLPAVAEGSEAAAAQVRQLDALYGRIQEGNALERQRLDNAAISIGLLRAQQAEERTLLEIELARRREAERASDTTSGTGTTDEDDLNNQFPDLVPVDNLFDEILLPGTEDFAERAKNRFDAAFEAAQNFVTGEGLGIDLSDPDDPNAFEDFERKRRGLPVGSPEGNVFERFFSDLGGSIRGGDKTIENAISDFRASLENNETLNSIEDVINDVLGLEGEHKFSFVALFDLIPEATGVLQGLIDVAAGALGINKWLKDQSGIQNAELLKGIEGKDDVISLGDLVVGFPKIVFKLIGSLATAWTEYVKDIQARLRGGGEGAEGLTAGERFIGIIFNEDFTINLTGAVEFAFGYLTAPKSDGEGNSLAADLDAWWDNGDGFFQAGEGIVKALAEGIETTVNLAENAGKFVLNLAGVLLGIALTTFRGVDQEGNAVETDIGALIRILIRAALGAVAFPLLAIDYVFNEEVVDLSISGLIAHIIGIDEDALANLPGEINTFLTETLPTALDEAFGEDNVFSGLLEVANTIRSRIHQVLFGEILFPDEESIGRLGGGRRNRRQVNREQVNRDRINNAARKAAADAQRLIGIGQRGPTGGPLQISRIPNPAEFQADAVQKAVAAEERKIAQDAQQDFENAEADALNITRPGGQAGARPVGLVGQIIARFQNIPEQIGEFLKTEAGKNIFNLHSILVGAGIIDQDTSLYDVWVEIVDEFTTFTEDPIGYTTTKIGEAIEGIIVGIEDFLGLEGNPISSGLSRIASSIRIAFGVGGVQDFVDEGFELSDSKNLANTQTAKSLGDVLLKAISDLWDNAVAYITNEENAEQFSFIDAILGVLFGEDVTLASSVADLDKRINEFFSGGGFNELPEQTQKFLDTLSLSIFGIPYEKLGERFGQLIGGLFDRLGAIFEEGNKDYVAPEDRDLTTYLQAIFDDDTLTAENIIPRTIEAILSIPGAIFDALKQTSDFGIATGEFDAIQVPFVEPSLTGLSQFGDEESAVRSARLRQQATQLEQDKLAEEGIEGIERRAFSITPLLNRIVTEIDNQASLFFSENPVGQFIIDAIQWFTGAEITYDGAIDSLREIITNDEVTLGSEMVRFFQDNPKFLGIESIVRFFTGDDEFTLAGLFQKGLDEEGGPSLGDKIAETFQGIIDGITGDVRAKDVLSGEFSLTGNPTTDLQILGGGDPDAIVGNQGNIFQRIADSLITAAKNAAQKLIDFNDAQGNILGLDNFIQALTGNDTITAKTWFESFQGELDLASADGRELTLPEYIGAFLEAFKRLLSGEGGGDIADNPIGNFVQNLKDAFDPEEPYSLGWHFNSEQPGSFAEAMKNFFESLPNLIATIPTIIFSILTLINNLERTLFDLKSNFSLFFGEPSDEQKLKFGVQDKLTAEDYTALIGLPDFDINDPIVIAELERVGLDADKLRALWVRAVEGEGAVLLTAEQLVSNAGVSASFSPVITDDVNSVITEYGSKYGALLNPILQKAISIAINAQGDKGLTDEETSELFNSIIDRFFGSPPSKEEIKETIQTSILDPVKTAIAESEFSPAGVPTLTTSTDEGTENVATTLAKSLISEPADVEALKEDVNTKIVEPIEAAIAAGFSSADSAFDVPTTDEGTENVATTFAKSLISEAEAKKYGSLIGTTYRDAMLGSINETTERSEIEMLVRSLEGESPTELGPFASIAIWGASVGASYRDAFVGAINDGIVQEDIQGLIDTISSVDSVPVSGPLASIGQWGSSIGQAWVSGFASTFESYFGGGESDEEDGEETESATSAVGAWSTILDSAYQSSLTFAQKLPTAFATIPGQLWDVFGEPTVKLFNHILESFNDTLRSLASAQNAAFGSGLLVPFINQGDIGSIVAAKISTSRPQFLQAEKGGTFGPGGLIVGERGPELIVPAERIAVFPTQATQGLAQLNSLLQRGQFVSNVNNTTYNYNTYNTSDDHSVSVSASSGARGSDIAMQLRANRVRKPSF